MADLVFHFSYPLIEQIWLIGHETLRKFVEYDPETGFGTEKPHERNLQQYAALYWAFHPPGQVAVPAAGDSPPLVPPLKSLLGADEAKALAKLTAFFSRAREQGIPPGMEGLEGWLESVLRAEHAAGGEYPPWKRRRRR